VTVGSRIAVIGCCGAGKSQLALALGEKLARLDGSQRVITLRTPHEVRRFLATL